MNHLLNNLPIILQNELGHAPSALFIYTSEPKWLLFRANSVSPIYVLQVGCSEKLRSVFKTTERLHSKMPKRIAEPLSLVPLGKTSESLLVQRGLSGTPWFSLRSRTRRVSGWYEVSEIALETLRDMHKATTSYQDWCEAVDPSSLFLKIYSQLKPSHLKRLPRLTDVMPEWSNMFSLMGVTTSFFQHGDFCINNLLFENSRAAVVDFEHFGRLSTPLHDELMLCGSLLSVHPNLDAKIEHALWTRLSERSMHRDLCLSKFVRPLFLLHLLWWLLESQDQPQRQARIDIYFIAINELLKEAPDAEWQPRLTLLAV